jgi:phosphoglycolate phosphatase
MVARLVVFDLDGTLVQTRAASWEVFQSTAARFGLPIRSSEEFIELFRDNFYDSLKRLCSSPEQEAEVRQHFLAGLRDRYEPHFIPGMRDVVKTLAARFPLAVLSSNTMAAIRRILETEGVAECFAHVFSAELGTSKEGALRQLLSEPSYCQLRHCSPSYVEGSSTEEFEVVLLTDTVGDIREARRCGVRCVGVAWGMHSPEALLSAGAETVALWPQELIAILSGALEPGPAACACATPTGGDARSCGCPSMASSPADPPLAPVAAAGRLRREARYRARLRLPASVTPLPPNSEQALMAAIRRISRTTARARSATTRA